MSQPIQQQDQQQPQDQPQQQQPQQPQQTFTPADLQRQLGGLFETINAMPDRIVDALRQTGATEQQQQAARQAAGGNGQQPQNNQSQQSQANNKDEGLSAQERWQRWFFGN